MNTKGIKFLAVLAVLAMAFAAFAILSTDSDTNEATELPTEKTYRAPGTAATAAPDVYALAAAESYAVSAAEKYVAVSGTVTISDKTGTTATTIYVVTGTTLSITKITEGTIIVIPVAISDTTNKTLVETSKISLTYSAATNATFKPVDNISADVGGTATISKGKVPAGTTLKIITSGKLAVSGELINDGEILNNSGVNNFDSSNAQFEMKTGAVIKSTSSSAKGIIKGTNEPLVTMRAGTLQDQVIDATLYTCSGSSGQEADMDQCVLVRSQTGDVKITGCDVKLNAGRSYGMYLFPAANKLEVSNNTFDAGSKSIRKALLLTITEVTTTAADVTIKDNDFSKVSYDLTTGKDGDLVFDSGETTAMITVGAIGGTANVKIDNKVRSIAVANSGSKDYLTIADSISADYLSVRKGATLNVNVGATITNGNTVYILGTLKFAQNTTSTTTISSLGIQGSGKILVGDTGKLFINEGTGNKWAIGQNELQILKGGKFVAIDFEASNQYWGIVGPTANTSGEPKGGADIDKFQLATSAMANATDSVTIKVNYASYPTVTGAVYTFDGNVIMAHSNSDGAHWFWSGDVVNIKSGEFILRENTLIREGVTYNVTAGAAIVGSEGTEILNVEGKVNLAEAVQYYKNIAFPTAGKGEVKVVGEGGSSSEKVVPKTTGTTIGADDFAGTDADVIVTTTANVVSATVPANKTVVINAVPANGAILNISADNSEIALNLTANTNTITIDAGGDNKIQLEGVTGALTFTKGSIVIDITDWTGGKIKIADGADVKIKGTTSSATSLVIEKLAGDKGSKLTIEEDTEVSVEFTAASQKFQIGANIAVVIDGKLTVGGTTAAYGNFQTDAKTTINGTVKVTGTYTSKAIDIFGTLIAPAVNAGGNVVAYGTSDINGATITCTDTYKLSGKDLDGGKWEYVDNKLTLTNYHGNYNFTQVGANDAITSLILSGTNKVTFVATEDYAGKTLFGGASFVYVKTVQGTGSLEIIADLSESTGAHLATGTGLIIFSGITGMEIDAVDLDITVIGSNNDWTATETKAMKVKGVYSAGTLDLYQSDVDMNVMTSYSAANVYGIDAVGKIKATSCEDLIISSAGTAINCANFDVKGTEVVANGKTLGMNVTGTLEVTNAAYVIVPNGLTVATLNVAQESKVEVSGLVLGTAIENNGVIETYGSSIINGSVNNLATLINEGTMGVYGEFKNTSGIFTNNGTFNVFNKEFKESAEVNDAIVITDVAPADTNKVRLNKVNLSSYEIKADGTIDVKATLGFYPVIVLKTGTTEFTGTLTPDQMTAGYTLTLSNGTANVTIVYTPADGTPKMIGKDFAVTVAGAVVTDAGVNMYLESNTTYVKDVVPAGATVVDKIVNDATPANNVVQISNAKFKLADGKIVNDGSFIVSSNAQAAEGDRPKIITGGTFEGALVTNIVDVNISGGTLKGNLTANGIGTVTVGNATGDIVSKGKVATVPGATAVTKKVKGNIDAVDDVTIGGIVEGNVVTKKSVSISEKGVMDGNVTVNGDTQTLTIAGKMDGTLIYNSQYKATKDATEKTTYTNTMGILADMTTSTKNFVIKLDAGKDATDTAAAVPGSFSFGTLNAPAEEKAVVLTITDEGADTKLAIPTNVSLPERFELIVEKGATIEVAKTATFDVKDAALKVSKDAIANFEVGTAPSVTYGKVNYIMSFGIDGGAYTIYSDVAYALTNCDEGAELTLGSAANINSNIAVKDGVNIIVKNVTLTFNGKNVEMGDGAKITLDGTGSVYFKPSGNNVAVADLDDDLEYEYYAVSGTIVFEDNAVVLDGVRFTNDSVIVGVAATSTAGDKISANLLYNEGMATIEAGTGTGSITLKNDAYALTKDAKGSVDKYTLVQATFIVGADAVFDAVSIADEFGKVKYANESGEVVIEKIRLLPTIVGVEGTLNLTASTTIKGVYSGLGTTTLAAGKEIVLAASGAKAAGDNVTVPAVVAAKFVDTTDDANGYVFNIVSAKYELTITVKATTQKIGTTTYDVMTIAGDVGEGIISGTTSAFIKGLVLEDNAALFAETVYVMDASTAKGSLGAKDIYMKEGTETSEFATLTYEVTFVEEGYTVYTYFKNVDFDEVTDITIAKDIKITDMIPATAKCLDLSGNDVNIVIAEGKKLVLDKPLIIGTPIDDLGDEGSSISGKIVIGLYEAGVSYDNAYLIAYSDVDLTEAEIYGYDGKTAAVYSVLDIEDIPYAIIFANENGLLDVGGGETKQAGQVLATVDKSIVPEIEGYIFTKWYNYDETEGSFVGQTNAYAGAKAVTVFVTVKFVTGITYYCNGIEFAVYDTPVKVDYDSVFTAKISDTSKYQGTPLVNGKNSLVITEDTEIVGSGVTPIPVPPEPEPVIGDSGISLTDILLIVLVVLIAIMVVILVLRLNRS